MAAQPSIPDLVAAGAARVPASTVVRGGRLVNVVSAEVYPADVAVYGNTVVAIGDVSAHIGDDTRIVEAEGRHLVPGLFDGHQHLECSKLSITSAAKMLVPLGTLNVVSGLDQILVVAGLGRGRSIPAGVPAHPAAGPVGAPCKTPYTLPTSTVGHYFGPDDHRRLSGGPSAWACGRPCASSSPPATPTCSRPWRSPARTACPCSAAAADGHRRRLTSYACAGIRLDHESYDSHECLEKLRNGMDVVIRESSFAPLPGGEHPSRAGARTRCEPAGELCTDDVVASDVLDRGHIDNMVRMAVDAGVERRCRPSRWPPSTVPRPTGSTT